MERRGIEELTRFLAHPDMRVRQEAQFELAKRGEAAWPTLAKVAGLGSGTLPRIHAVWGLEQVARAARDHSSRLWPVVGPLLGDPDPEVRAQAAKVLGERARARSSCRPDQAADRPAAARSLLGRDRTRKTGSAPGNRAAAGSAAREQ